MPSFDHCVVACLGDHLQKDKQISHWVHLITLGDSEGEERDDFRGSLATAQRQASAIGCGYELQPVKYLG